MAILSVQTGEALSSKEIDFDLLDSNTQQNLVDEWVNDNVIQIVNELAESTLQNPESEYWETLHAISVYEDWEEPARYEGWIPLNEWLGQFKDGKGEHSFLTAWRAIYREEGYQCNLKTALEDDEFFVHSETVNGYLIINESNHHNNWQDLCEYQSIDPYTEDAMQYFQVSEHFDAYVGGSEYIMGLLVWPRFCRGQDISLDNNVIYAYRQFHNKYL